MANTKQTLRARFWRSFGVLLCLIKSKLVVTG